MIYIYTFVGYYLLMNLLGMSDLFVKCWPEGCAPQETDTHWRCKKGKASWNYRLLFEVELGHSTKAMKFPYFHIQVTSFLLQFINGSFFFSFLLIFYSFGTGIVVVFLL
jgi:hypothetical protein